MAKIKMQPLDAETVTLEECFADYMAKCRARNLSDKTLEIYEVRFSIFQKYLNGKELKPYEIDQDVIDSFILYLQKRGCNDITVQSYIRDIRAFFYYLMNNGFTPEYKIKLPKADKKIKETYTDEELKMLTVSFATGYPKSFIAVRISFTIVFIGCHLLTQWANIPILP